MSRIRSAAVAGVAIASLSIPLAAGLPVVSAAEPNSSANVAPATEVVAAAKAWAKLKVDVPTAQKGKALRVSVHRVEKGADTVRLERLKKGRWVTVDTAPAMKGHARVRVPARLVGPKAVTFRVSSANRQNVFVVDSDLKAGVNAVPAAVKNLKATVYATSASLTWSAVTGAASYLVEMSTDDGDTFETVGTTTKVAYDVSGLTTDRIYVFRVSAVNAEGAGPGATVRVRTQANPPAPVSVLTVTPLDSQVKLGWPAAARAISYTLQRTCEENVNFDSSVCAVDTRTSVSRSFNWGGLVNGRTYLFRVYGTNQDGAGAPAAAEATPMPRPNVVSNFVATPGDGTIFGRWTPVANAVDYRIGVDEVGGSRQYVYSDFSPNNFNQVSGLKNGTAYNVIVQARNPYGTTSTLAIPNVVPNADVPGEPQGLTVTPGDTKATLTWDVDPSASSYVVFKRVAGTDEFLLADTEDVLTGEGTVTRTVTGLTNGVRYEFEVYATNTFGRSFSAFAYATPEASPAP